jgi:hypothetical protein
MVSHKSETTGKNDENALHSHNVFSVYTTINVFSVYTTINDTQMQTMYPVGIHTASGATYIVVTCFGNAFLQTCSTCKPTPSRDPRDKNPAR